MDLDLGAMKLPLDFNNRSVVWPLVLPSLSKERWIHNKITICPW